MYEEFANGLSTDTADSKGTADQHKDNVRELLNFFPVIGEDKNGKMVELDAEQVLLVPRKLKSQEVVNRGFMSNFLFQNVTNVFRAPQSVLDILNKFEPVEEKDAKIYVEDMDDLYLGCKKRNIDIPEPNYRRKGQQYFWGEKSMLLKMCQVKYSFHGMAKEPNEKQKELNRLKKELQVSVVDPLKEVAKEEYGKDLTSTQKKKLDKKLKEDADRMIDKIHTNHNIETTKLNINAAKNWKKLSMMNKL